MAEPHSLNRIRVTNVGKNVTQADVISLFSAYGAIESVMVSRNPEGLALVDFESREQAEKAVRALNDKPNLNSTENLRLKIVDPTKAHSSDTEEEEIEGEDAGSKEIQ